MKRLLIIFFVLMNCGAVPAMVVIVESNIQKYDSISNFIDKTSLDMYLGQTIYFPKGDINKYFGFEGVFKEPGQIYNENNLSNAEFNSLEGRYFKIDSIEQSGGKEFFSIVDTIGHERLLYLPDPKISFIVVPQFVFVGYLKKMEQLYVGGTFYFSRYIKRKCILYYLDDNTNKPSLKFDDGYQMPLYNGFASNSYDNEKAYKAESNKQEAIKKYGNLRLGLKRGIVIKICGYPDKINKQIDYSGTHEQLIYSDKYIYIDNGIVTCIQNEE